MKAKTCCFLNLFRFPLAQESYNLLANYMQQELPKAKLSTISSSSSTDDSAFYFDYRSKDITR